MTWIKICGITNPEDAQTAVEAGADALGFIFYPASPRQIAPEKAGKIIQQLPQSVEKIGVFVNQSLDEVSRIAEEIHLTAVQFHGDEYQNQSRLLVNRRILLGVPWSSMRGEGGRPKTSLWLAAPPEPLMAIVIDAGTKQQRGGTGKSFDWHQAADAISGLKQRHPVVIAGGLTPDNVETAMEILHPWGVDVSSGVEAKLANKDATKVRAFVQAVRVADQRNGNH
jgi:phosphoribosylanthranilate isomerase